MCAATSARQSRRRRTLRLRRVASAQRLSFRRSCRLDGPFGPNSSRSDPDWRSPRIRCKRRRLERDHMADVLEMAPLGIRIEFLKSAEQTGAESLEMEVSGRTRGFLAQRHVHPSQVERPRGAPTRRRAGPPRRAPGPYLFIDEWDGSAPPEAVVAALADARTYPTWWQEVYLDVDGDDDPAVGGESRQHFKGRLPYHL